MKWKMRNKISCDEIIYGNCLRNMLKHLHLSDNLFKSRQSTCLEWIRSIKIIDSKISLRNVRLLLERMLSPVA